MRRMRWFLAPCLALALAGPSALFAQETGKNSGSITEKGAPADDKQVALDALLKQLKTADNEQTASVIEEAVWQLWLRSGSDTVDLLMSRVADAMKEEDHSLALDLLNRVVDIKPDYAEGWNKRATVLFFFRDYARSLQDVERVLNLEPRHFGALSGLGLIMQEFGDRERALQAFRRALEIHPFLPAAVRAEKQLSQELEGRGI